MIKSQLETLDLPSGLVSVIKTFPLVREIEHCGLEFTVSPFAIYATCPHCGTELKVRSFASQVEVEDVFDAVFEWLTQPGAVELVRQRQRQMEDDLD